MRQPTSDRMQEIRHVLAGVEDHATKIAFFEKLLCELDQVGTSRNDPVQSVLAHANNYWGAAILYILQAGTFRHAALHRLLGLASPRHQISQRMLTLNLRILERDGLIERRVHRTPTPSVDYRLTQIGQEMVMLLRRMVEWATGRRDEIRAARALFDANRGLRG